MTVVIGAVPGELAALRQWVLWRSVDVGKDKPTKRPYTVHGSLASVTDPHTWATYEDVTAALQSGTFDGIGFVFTADDPYVGIDLDNCIDLLSGDIAPWAKSIIDRCASFTQYSPTETGVHIYVRGVLPSTGGKRGDFEIYDQGRYFTFGGDPYPGTPSGMVSRGALVAALYHEYITPPSAPFVAVSTNGHTNGHAKPDDYGTPRSDGEVVNRAMTAKNGAAFTRLWNGDTSAHPSSSEADLALCNHLAFWTQNDPQQIDRLFRQSGLFRPKWDTRHGTRTYGQMTIDKATTDRNETFSGNTGTTATLKTGSATTPSDDHNTPVSQPMSPDVLAALIAHVPELSDAAQLTEFMEAAARNVRAVWLDPYIGAATVLSPRSPRSLHEAAALFALNTVIARRAYVRAGARRYYPVLFTVFVGRSTITAKTSAMETLRSLLQDAGYLDLLLPSTFTPQALLVDLAAKVTDHVKDLTGDDQARWLARHKHAAQRAIIRDEVSGIFDDCKKDYNSGLLPLLLKLADAPDHLEGDLTVARGVVEPVNVGVNIIGCTTPSSFREHASKPYHWSNGLFGRIGLLSTEETPEYAFWPEDIDGMPSSLVALLRRIYNALPPASCSFRTESTGEGKSEKSTVAGVELKYEPVAVTLSAEARAAWERYDHALHDMCSSRQVQERLDGTYGRLPAVCLRIAIALAVADWAHHNVLAERILLDTGHWTAAQEITERWRHSAHAVLAAALQSESDEAGNPPLATLKAFLRKRQGKASRGSVLQLLHWKSDYLDTVIATSSGTVTETTHPTEGRNARYVEISKPITRINRINSDGTTENDSDASGEASS